mmetsp:Transcript_11650/g.40227  ORF Transcript_11650/g.40227 Transcript_11650/m.40227 type:complete len:131 (+) Transcript_11650:1094-1486(+)
MTSLLRLLILDARYVLVLMPFSRDQCPQRVLAPNCKSLKTTTISGSPAYMAPEQLQGQELTESVDNWALAVVLWEIMMDKKPWEGRFSDFKYLKAAVLNGEKLHLPVDPRPYPPCYVNMIKLGMQYKVFV